MAGTAAHERQLTSIVNLDDGFQAASSPDRLSSLDSPRKLRSRQGQAPLA
jgi:hypothetical protein